MLRKLRLDSFNIDLFWKFFVKYFLLIMLPTIAASVFLYGFVVQHTEGEMRKSNEQVIRQFSEQVDSMFLSLQADMIRTLNAPSVQGFMKVMHEDRGNQRRIEAVHALMKQLRTFEEKGYVANAYLYFTHADIVVDGSIHTTKDYYFNVKYPVDEEQQAAFPELFSGRKMMHFGQPAAEDGDSSSEAMRSVVMSFPFNKYWPDVYLVVDIQQSKLDESIRIREDWIAATAIVTASGELIGRSGDLPLDAEMLAGAVREAAGKPVPIFHHSPKDALSFYRSDFHDGWYYVSLIDMKKLMQPAEQIRSFSIAFLVFFLLLGGAVSIYLSRKLSEPIVEIKTGLEKHKKSEGKESRVRGEIALIKHFSELLISENKQLSGKVDELMPIAHEFFLRKVLLGEFRDHLSIQLYAQEIDFAYEANAARTVFCIEQQYYAGVSEQFSETSKSFILIELKEKIARAFEGGVWFCQTPGDVLACIVHHGKPSQYSAFEAAERIKNILTDYADMFKSVIAIGKTVHDMSQLHLSCEHALSMLRQKSLHEGVEICSEESFSEGSIYGESFISNDEIVRISNMYKAGEYDRILQSVFDMLDDGMRVNAGACQVKQMCVDVLNTWIRTVELEKKDFNMPHYVHLYRRLEQVATWDEMKQFFREAHKSLFQPPEPFDRKHRMGEILQYIQEHFHEDLSIEQFAHRMNMSAGNFSRVFKEEVGERYVEYITRLRLNHAKRLLIETNMTMDEIAERVGYLGRNSFIRVFRKFEGITPGKYRESFQAADIASGAANAQRH